MQKIKSVSADILRWLVLLGGEGLSLYILTVALILHKATMGNLQTQYTVASKIILVLLATAYVIFDIVPVVKLAYYKHHQLK